MNAQAVGVQLGERIPRSRASGSQVPVHRMDGLRRVLLIASTGPATRHDDHWKDPLFAHG